MTLRTITAAIGFAVLALAFSPQARAAEEKPTAFNQFFIDIFNPAKPATEAAKPRKRSKAVRTVAQPVAKPATQAVAKPAAQPETAVSTAIPAPKPDPEALRSALKDSLAQNPDVLRGIVADFVRGDTQLRRMLADAAPKPEATPAPPAAAPAPAPAPQQQAGAIGRTEIEQIIRDYIVSHPEILQEAMVELEKRQAAGEAEKHQAAVKTNAAILFSSPRQVNLGNPQGTVTFVEFFDYNCGYCKRAMTDMFALMKEDPKLKVVLKEFPVLGPGSVEAAQVAIAVNMQDKTGKKYVQFHEKLMGARGQADKAHALAVAKEIGMNMAQLEKDMAGPEIKATLDESFKLAEALGMNGTPSYVIGDSVVVGAVGLDALRERVNTARCGKATC